MYSDEKNEVLSRMKSPQNFNEKSFKSIAKHGVKIMHNNSYPTKNCWKMLRLLSLCKQRNCISRRFLLILQSNRVITREIYRHIYSTIQCSNTKIIIVYLCSIVFWTHTITNSRKSNTTFCDSLYRFSFFKIRMATQQNGAHVYKANVPFV